MMFSSIVLLFLLIILIVTIVLKIANKKQNIAITITLFLFIFLMLTILYVYTVTDSKIGNSKDFFNFIKVYFVWLGNIFENVKTVTAQVIKMDWAKTS